MAENSTQAMILDPLLRNAVERELSPGEQVLWLDRPSPARVFRRYLPIGLIGLAWIAAMLAAAVWVSGGLRPALAVPEVHTWPHFWWDTFLRLALVGLAAVMVPFVYMRRARHTVYVLTSTRLLLVARGFRASARSFPFTHLRVAGCTERRDGSGDLAFEWYPTPTSPIRARRWRRVRLFGIARVRHITNLLCSTAAQAKTAPSTA